MPYYEYHCASNGRTIEVRHGMNEVLSTWGQVAERAGAALDGATVQATPADAPVERLMSVPAPLTSEGGTPAFQGCGSGCACAPQRSGH
jgi:hypothetical protein